MSIRRSNLRFARVDIEVLLNRIDMIREVRYFSSILHVQMILAVPDSVSIVTPVCRYSRIWLYPYVIASHGLQGLGKLVYTNAQCLLDILEDRVTSTFLLSSCYGKNIVVTLFTLIYIHARF